MITTSTNWRKEYCGLGRWRPQFLQSLGNVRCFTTFAALITLVQGVYLGYMIGVLTTIEKRFRIPSAWSGGLLSVYDLGHAISVLVVGHYGSVIHQPKWIAGGAALSSVACFGLLLPHFIFGGGGAQTSTAQQHFVPENTSSSTERFVDAAYCSRKMLNYLSGENDDNGDTTTLCSISISAENSNHQNAYVIFAIFQLLAGVASSPFTTLSYVYIDDNATRKQSPFYMGIVTAMWAYGPAIGFGLSSYTTQVWVDLGSPPRGLTTDNPNWIGAWWLGLTVLCILYLCFGLPFVFYPARLNSRKRRPAVAVAATTATGHSPPHNGTGDAELLESLNRNRTDGCDSSVNNNNNSNNNNEKKTFKRYLAGIADLPCEFIRLLRNRMVLSLSLSWIAGAYLFGGYCTFLPKYLEVVFFKATFTANILGGIVAVIGMATSTAVGGKVLAWLNPKAPKALMLVVITFLHSLVAFLLLMFVACDNPTINGLSIENVRSLIDTNNFTSPVCTTTNSNSSYHLHDEHEYECSCTPLIFSPVCDTNSDQTFFSPCYLGCGADPSGNDQQKLDNCACATGAPGKVESGYCDQPCNSKLTMYLIVSFLGGAVGAFFQMALFTNIIWAVPNEKKTNVVALSNFLMSVFGFLPSQVVYGKIFDSACVAWSVDDTPIDSSCGGGGDHSSSSSAGYCLLYDNRSLRFRYHAWTAAFQFAAAVFVLMGYFASRKYAPLPKRNNDDEEEEADEGDDTGRANALELNFITGNN